MRYIASEQIVDLQISPSACVDWAREAFLKNRSQLSPQIWPQVQRMDLFRLPQKMKREKVLYGQGNSLTSASRNRHLRCKRLMTRNGLNFAELLAT